jgi:hypothetical protein
MNTAIAQYIKSLARLRCFTPRARLDLLATISPQINSGNFKSITWFLP